MATSLWGSLLFFLGYSLLLQVLFVTKVFVQGPSGPAGMAATTALGSLSAACAAVYTCYFLYRAAAATARLRAEQAPGPQAFLRVLAPLGKLFRLYMILGAVGTGLMLIGLLGFALAGGQRAGLAEARRGFSSKLRPLPAQRIAAPVPPAEVLRAVTYPSPKGPRQEPSLACSAS